MLTEGPRSNVDRSTGSEISRRHRRSRHDEDAPLKSDRIVMIRVALTSTFGSVRHPSCGRRRCVSLRQSRARVVTVSPKERACDGRHQPAVAASISVRHASSRLITSGPDANRIGFRRRCGSAAVGPSLLRGSRSPPAGRRTAARAAARPGDRRRDPRIGRRDTGPARCAAAARIRCRGGIGHLPTQRRT